MRLFANNNKKGPVIAPRLWFARVGGIVSPAATLAACLLMPSAYAQEKAVQATVPAVAMGAASATTVSTTV